MGQKNKKEAEGKQSAWDLAKVRKETSWVMKGLRQIRYCLPDPGRSRVKCNIYCRRNEAVVIASISGLILHKIFKDYNLNSTTFLSFFLNSNKNRLGNEKLPSSQSCFSVDQVTDFYQGPHGSCQLHQLNTKCHVPRLVATTEHC